MSDRKQKSCGICSGELVRQGQLGDLIHYLCRDCGMWWNRRIKRKKKRSIWDH